MGSKKPNNKVVRILSKNWVEKQIKLTLVTSLSHQDQELELFCFCTIDNEREMIMLTVLEI